MKPIMARLLYFGLQTVRREPVRKALHDVLSTEYFSEDALKELQAKRQIAQLQFAVQHVPHYRRGYAHFEGRINQAVSFEDVNALMLDLPILEKDYTRQNSDSLIADNLDRLATAPNKTSGTTGAPIYFPCDQNAWAYRHALLFRQLRAYRISIGEPYAYFWGSHWGKGAHYQTVVRDWIFNRTRISAYSMTAEKTERYLREILNKQPTHFIGYPSTLYDFCAQLHTRGLDQLQKLKLKVVLTTAEPLRAYQRQLIEEVTGSQCSNQYGSADGGFTAFECPHRSLHIATEASWVQTKESNQHTGDAVINDMFTRAFPLIKYAIGDVISLRPEKCTCGRQHPLLAGVEGRSGAPITLPNGRVINSHKPGYIFKNLGHLGVIRKYRFVHTPDDQLHLYLTVSKNFRKDHLVHIKREVTAAFGEDCPVEIRIVEHIPDLPNAKHRDYVRLEK